MSAFLCSDKQFAVVARWMFPLSRTQAQHYANNLKRENLRSVNAAHKENQRFKAVDLKAGDDWHNYNKDDILRLLSCIDYQSGEHSTYDQTLFDMSRRYLIAHGADENKSHIWSI